MSDINEVRATTGELRRLADEDQKKIDKLTKKLDRHDEVNHFSQMLIMAMGNKRKERNA